MSTHERGIVSMLVTIMLAGQLLHAQADSARPEKPGWCRGGTACRTVSISESSFTIRLGSSGGDTPVQFGGALGAVAPISARVGLGGYVQVGVGDDAFIAVGPRVRFHTSPNAQVDLSPGVVISGDHEGGGRPRLGVSWMYRDQVGLALEVDWFDRYASSLEPPYYRSDGAHPVVRTGMRLGSRPGRTGLIVQGVLLVVAGVAFAISCSSGCFGY